MAGRRPRASSELVPDPSTSSPDSKRSRIDKPERRKSSTSEEGAEKEAEVCLETTEKLAPSTSESSSGEESTTVAKEMVTYREISVAGTSRDEDFTSLMDEDTDLEAKNLSQRIIEEQRATTSGASSASAGATSGAGTSLVGEHAHYEEISVIGDGAYGTVYKAKDLTSGQVVALKKIRVPLTEDGLPTSTLREIAGLKQLERFEHPHIVRLLDVCQGKYLQLPTEGELTERVDRGLTLWLVFEHVERDLASFIASRNRSPIPAAQTRQMSKEILLGVDFLHSHRIIHRDLKPQNLLVTSEGRIKIADFGLAKTYDFEMRLTSVVVTLWYRAPEVFLGCPYATPVDLWSVGCILAEINRLQPLLPGTSEGDQLDRIFQVVGTPSQADWPENVSLSWNAFPFRRATPLRDLIPNLDDQGIDLIRNLLTFDPHVRLTAAQALKHPYFSGM